MNAKLATGALTEDLALGLALTANGRGPLLCAGAGVVSELPASDRGAAAQRTRWEHGYLATLLHAGPRLLGQSAGRPALLITALDLCVPPLTLLLACALAALAATAGLAWLALSSWAPALLTGIALSATGATLTMVWWVHGRELLSLSQALALPRYLLWKMPIYARFIRAREQRWVRTERGQ